MNHWDKSFPTALRNVRVPEHFRHKTRLGFSPALPQPCPTRFLLLRLPVGKDHKNFQPPQSKKDLRVVSTPCDPSSPGRQLHQQGPSRQGWAQSESPCGIQLPDKAGVKNRNGLHTSCIGGEEVEGAVCGCLVPVRKYNMTLS